MTDETKLAMELEPTTNSFFEFVINTDLSISMNVNGYFVLLAIALILCVLGWRLFSLFQMMTFEIDGAELGIGNQKIKLRPNNIDAKIAYQIWVELSTRKIGTRIDKEKDVITEVYNSWYKFFEITRELIKEIPVSKIKNNETRKIVELSIDVLNRGIRPHLTTWQAKYRRWYENESCKDENRTKTPQDIQKEYPEYEELMKDMLKNNSNLIEYNKLMYQLASKLKPTKQRKD